MVKSFPSLLKYISVISTGLRRAKYELFYTTSDDGCTKDCNEGGLCVYDATRNQQCVCADGYVETEDGTCQGKKKSYIGLIVFCTLA